MSQPAPEYPLCTQLLRPTVFPSCFRDTPSFRLITLTSRAIQTSSFKNVMVRYLQVLQDSSNVTDARQGAAQHAFLFLHMKQLRISFTSLPLHIFKINFRVFLYVRHASTISNRLLSFRASG